MASLQCPYCSMVMPITADTNAIHFPSFDSQRGVSINGTDDSCVAITFNKCPNCNQYIIKAKGEGQAVKDIDVSIRPSSSAVKYYPDYIPLGIRQDYEEACAIVKLSPKASATLSRRCLQGMIHDFWDIKEKNLNAEITSLKDKVPADLWSSLDSLRQLGNIGAHMEKDTNVIIDIDSNEADALIQLIELLMKEWYINREDRKLLFSSIVTINETKQAARKKSE